MFDAVLLAAGLGSRLRSTLGPRPKPLLELGGRSLLERSLEQLQEAGLSSLTVVVGYGADYLIAALTGLRPDALVVPNPAFASTGSMRSLALARGALAARAPDPVLVVEGDLLYGPPALSALAGAPRSAAAVLTSPPTGAGDEVWVSGEDGRIREISKAPSGAHAVLGELVGLTRLSWALLSAMSRSHFGGGDAAAGEHYEERLSLLSGAWGVRAVVAEGLVWTEIDDPDHLARARDVILPRLEGR